MKILFSSFLIAGLLITAGCGANRSGVVIDPEGVDMAMYQRDLHECQQIARQVDGSEAAGSAAGGAAVGGVIGGIVGNSSTVGRGAGIGGVLGLARGARATRAEREKVVKNCLRNRGYAVLN